MDAVFLCARPQRTEFGLSVPQDVSVVGFDDVPPASWPAYNLTTYRQRVGAMVKETVDIVTATDTNLKPRRVVIEGALMIRGTTGKHRNAPLRADE